MPSRHGTGNRFHSPPKCAKFSLNPLDQAAKNRMMYEYLKILHIVSASLVIGSILYSCQLWLAMQRAQDGFPLFHRIQKQTALVIIPATLIQLGTGFTLISLQHYGLDEAWIGTSITGFLVMVASWLGFIFFLTAAQKQLQQNQFRHSQPDPFYRRAQSIMLLFCGLSLAVMIFSMANRFSGSTGTA